jgi:hypothetical protein
MDERIKETLVALLGAIKRADAGAVACRMAELDAFLRDGRATLHPQLVHFLERRSYPKALMFLGGEPDIPAGTCDGRR